MGRQLLLWWTYWFGIRFYKTVTVPISSEVLRSEFKTVGGQEIHFLFFREVYEDIVFKRNRFFTLETHAFILVAKFGDDIVGPVVTFNHAKYLFRGIHFHWFSDQNVSDVLLNIYLKFIRSKIK